MPKKLTSDMRRALDIIGRDGFATAGRYMGESCNAGFAIRPMTLKALELAGLVELYTHHDGTMAARLRANASTDHAQMKLWFVTWENHAAVSIGATAKEAVDRIRRATSYASPPLFTATEVREGWRHVS